MLSFKPKKKSFQSRVHHWFCACFDASGMFDLRARIFAFAEEADELKQAAGMSRAEAHAMTDHVYDRDPGRIGQELAGTLTTLSLLAEAHSYILLEEGERELERISQPETIKKIRVKQGDKLTPKTFDERAKRNAPQPSIFFANTLSVTEVKEARHTVEDNLERLIPRFHMLSTVELNHAKDVAFAAVLLQRASGKMNRYIGL